MDAQAKSRQHVITKENYPVFRARILEAKARRQLAKEKAQALADAITKSEPQAIEARLRVQAAAIHEAILGAIANPGTSPKGGSEKVRAWLECQKLLLSQIRNSPEPSQGKRPGRRPEIAPIRPANQMASDASSQMATEQPQPVQDAPFPARVEPEAEHEQSTAQGSQGAACPPLELGEL